MSRAGSGTSWVRTQPTELATTHSAASHLAARSRRGKATGRRSTTTPRNLSLTSALRRAKSPASDAARTARPVHGRLEDWLRHVHRRNAFLGNLIAILAGGSLRGQSCSALCPCDAVESTDFGRRLERQSSPVFH